MNEAQKHQSSNIENSLNRKKFLLSLWSNITQFFVQLSGFLFNNQVVLNVIKILDGIGLKYSP